jgi:hypothetical protein
MLFSGTNYVIFLPHRIPHNEQMHSIPSPSNCMFSNLNSQICTLLGVDNIQHSPLQHLLASLPSNLISLKMQHFNKTCDKLPPNLTHLITAIDFNQSLDELPPTLTHLTAVDSTNQWTLSPTLTHLITTRDFNQPVDKLPRAHTSYYWRPFQSTSQ